MSLEFTPRFDKLVSSVEPDRCGLCLPDAVSNPAITNVGRPGDHPGFATDD
jgi:hypothetical protein